MKQGAGRPVAKARACAPDAVLCPRTTRTMRHSEDAIRTSPVVRYLSGTVLLVVLLIGVFELVAYPRRGMTSSTDLFNLAYGALISGVAGVGLVGVLGLLAACRLSRSYCVPLACLCGTLTSWVVMALLSGFQGGFGHVVAWPTLIALYAGPVAATGCGFFVRTSTTGFGRRARRWAWAWLGAGLVVGIITSVATGLLSGESSWINGTGGFVSTVICIGVVFAAVGALVGVERPAARAFELNP